jgi:superfamily I DNA and/or RNA helicase
VPAIGELISHCFYDDLLKSADKEWDRTLASILPTPVVWCSTSAMPDRFEIAAGDSYRNERELELVHDILRKISTQAALAGKTFSVAVLTGYGPQRTTMERRFAGSLKACKNLDIEWNTVDSVQGREADIAIYSVTRSNRSGKLGFLKETSRLNVALSRAKQYLVLIGDQAFLRNTPGENPFKRVLRFIDEHPQGCTIAESNL